jgi:hypothetical protein
LDPKGILATGEIKSSPHEGEHWDPEKRKRGDKGWFVEVEFSTLKQNPLVSWDQLQIPSLKGFAWGTPAPGIEISAPYLEELERLWDRASLQV